ncbi:MAG: nucleotidyltransferase domain-containing protein, partial [Pseudomonadota bacterium]|nr:nucleotidyltransferase domain-containing protein [Pseudomonadota bacterium]
MEPKTADPSASADESLDLLIAGLKNPPEQDDHRYCDALAGASASLEARFRAGESVVELVHIRSRMIDRLLLQLWRQFVKEARAAATLIAVGGYGRGELHPYSDIDIMVLVSDDVSAIIKKEIGHFLTSLWNLGLEIGHSVRTVDDCISLATGDITIATTLMEARLLDGDAALFTRMETSVSPDRIWSSERFFAEKLLEQKVRHHRYDDTAYKLEPNVKGSPG